MEEHHPLLPATDGALPIHRQYCVLEEHHLLQAGVGQLLIVEVWPHVTTEARRPSWLASLLLLELTTALCGSLTQGRGQLKEKKILPSFLDIVLGCLIE